MLSMLERNLKSVQDSGRDVVEDRPVPLLSNLAALS